MLDRIKSLKEHSLEEKPGFMHSNFEAFCRLLKSSIHNTHPFSEE